MTRGDRVRYPSPCTKEQMLCRALREERTKQMSPSWLPVFSHYTCPSSSCLLKSGFVFSDFSLCARPHEFCNSWDPPHESHSFDLKKKKVWLLHFFRNCSQCKPDVTTAGAWSELKAVVPQKSTKRSQLVFVQISCKEPSSLEWSPLLVELTAFVSQWKQNGTRTFLFLS